MSAEDQRDEQASGVAKLQNGWGRVSIDYFRAIMTETTGYEAIIMVEVIEQSWFIPCMTKRPSDPLPDPQRCKLNITDLAKRTGLHRSLLNNAKRSLIRKGLIRELAAGAVIPNKDYANGWPGASFLAKGNVREHCRRGADLLAEARSAAPPEKVSGKPANQPGKVSGKPDTPLLGKPATPDGKLAGKPANQATPIPIRESIKDIKTETNSRACAPASKLESADQCPPLPDENGPWDIWPGEHEPTPEEVRQTFALAWHCFPGTRICFEYFERQRFHATAAWRDAIREAAKQKPGLDRINYVETIAANNPNGIPRKRSAARSGTPALLPSPPLPRLELTERQRERYAPKPRPALRDEFKNATLDFENGKIVMPDFTAKRKGAAQ